MSAASARAPRRSRSERHAAHLAASPWTQAHKPYRVHYYNPKARGTWLSYFDTLDAAQAFAVGRTVWSEISVVEINPDHAATEGSP